jgi:heme/copper-type cytochrome/quinol oxidase subunit 1
MVLVLLISFFVSSENSALDLHIHDTYFVVTNAHVLWVVAIVLLLLWYIYFVLRKILFSKILTWLHIVSTLIGVVVLVILPFLTENVFLPKQRNYYDFNSWEEIGIIYDILALVIFFGQIILIIHFTLGVIKFVLKK